MTTPLDYAETAVLARAAAQELLGRLELIKLQPQYILDLGCGIGLEVQDLALRYPQAKICGLDLAQDFLQYGKNQTQEERVYWLGGDSRILPLRSNSVDLIFANMLLPWVQNVPVMLREWRRVLRPQGLVIFSSLGPDSFVECQDKNQTGFLPELVDMHNIGDAFVTAGFVDPVLEVEHFTLTYRDQAQLQAELEKSGMWIKTEHPQLEPNREGLYPLSFEVVYGHAWCPGAKTFKPDDHGIVSIPISQLRK